MVSRQWRCCTLRWLFHHLLLPPQGRPSADASDTNSGLTGRAEGKPRLPVFRSNARASRMRSSAEVREVRTLPTHGATSENRPRSSARLTSASVQLLLATSLLAVEV